MSKKLNSFLKIDWWAEFVDAIGNWNPILLHELKNHISLRNVGVSILLSIGLQVFLVALVYAAGIESYLLLVFMATMGVYCIASSFDREERQGTLELLRITPASAATVLMGKLLGAPILVYLAGAAAVPLQFYVAQGAQISLMTVVIWDLEIVGLMTMFYLGAALLTLRFKTQPIVLAASAGGLSILLIFISLMSSVMSSTVEWYGIPLTHPLVTFLASAILAGVVIYWLYQALKRTYNRTATILSRGQSYLWSLSYHLFLLGLCITSSPEGNGGLLGLSFNAALQTYRAMESAHPIYGDLPGLFWSLLSFWLLSLIPLIRFGNADATRTNHQALSIWAKEEFTQSSWLKTILFDDRCPPLLAILANLAIATSVWSIPALLMLPTIDISDLAFVATEGDYDVSSFGIDFPFWLLAIFIVMSIGSISSSSSLLQRVCNSPLWVTGTMMVIIYPTISWLSFRH